MRMARIYKVNSQEEKIDFVADYCRKANKQGIVFAFSEDDCKSLVARLSTLGISADTYTSGIRSHNNRSQVLEASNHAEKFLNGELKVLVTPLKYAVDIQKIAPSIQYILYYDRPTFMSDYIKYYDEIYALREEGDCAVVLVNGVISEGYDSYFLEKAPSYEMVIRIANFYMNNRSPLSEVDIAKAFNLGISDIRYSHRFMIDRGMLVKAYPDGAKYHLVCSNIDERCKGIEQDRIRLGEEYQKMLQYCWQ